MSDKYQSPTQLAEVQRSHDHEDKETVYYRQRKDGGWDVQTPVDNEFWGFMHSGSEETAQQLIRKKWDYRYNPDPDDFEDRS